MAITVTTVRMEDHGERKEFLLSIALDNSYPTGGEAVDISNVEEIDVLVAYGGKGGYDYDWDAANQKLILRRYDYDAVADGTAIEVANTTDVSAVTALKCWGIGQ